MMHRKLLIGIASLILIGCKKDPAKGVYYGTASAIFNGKAWNAGTVRSNINVPCYKGKLGFEFNVYNKQGFLRETLSFEKIPIAKGTYSINPLNYNDPLCKDTVATALYGTSQDHGDVALDFYNVIPSPDNYFTINNYNERTKELTGSFEVTFKITTRQDPNSPDTIRVSNGRFYTKILE